MRYLILTGFLLLLAACGQSGDLYLPPEQSEEPVAAPPAAETPAAEKDPKKVPPKEPK